MRKLFRVVVYVLAAVGLGVLLAGVSVIRGGFSARPKALPLEPSIADGLRDLAMPGKAKKLANPLPQSPDVLAKGRRHFAHDCAGCHGPDGSGTDFGRSMYPPVPDLRDGVKDMTEGEIHFVVSNGIRFSGMPAFGKPGDAGDERENWQIARFVHHLPDVTPEELVELRRMAAGEEPHGGAPAEAAPARAQAPGAKKR